MTQQEKPKTFGCLLKKAMAKKNNLSIISQENLKIQKTLAQKATIRSHLLRFLQLINLI
jgi:hypothetical protein